MKKERRRRRRRTNDLQRREGIIRLVSISPWRETFIGIVAPDVNRKRKGWTKIGWKVGQRKHARRDSRNDVPIVPNSRFVVHPLYKLTPSCTTPSSSVSYRCYTRFQLPFSAETRFLHDFRPTERINTVELNPRIGVD